VIQFFPLKSNWEACMRHRTTLVIGTLLLILCTTLALAQGSFAPPKPGPEVQQLGKFVGEWTTVGTVKPGPMGPGGKVTGIESCEWVSGGYAVLCKETAIIPGIGKLTDVALMSYDPGAKDYVFFQVNDAGEMWIARGTNDGDTWIWTSESTKNGQTMHLRFTTKWMSPDSNDFKNEAGPNADAMRVMMDGTETRVKPPAVKPAAK
jgi:hypothetical protein